MRRISSLFIFFIKKVIQKKDNCLLFFLRDSKIINKHGRKHFITYNSNIIFSLSIDDPCNLANYINSHRHP